MINQPKRGFCELSPIGRQLDLAKLTSITNEFLMQFESFSNYKLGISKENQEIQQEKILIQHYYRSQMIKERLMK